MSDLLDFKCPHCGGKLEFDAAVQKMKCPYCDSELDIEALQKNEEILAEVGKEDSISFDESAGQEWEQGETDGMNVYSCNSCGGEIVADDTTGATHCPYCGNPVVMTAKFAGALKPDYIIPFSITKEQAKDALKKHYKGKKYLPRVFSDDNHLDEIKGLYVPFWLFDGKADASINYKMSNTRVWEDRNFMYTETSHFSGYRKGSVSFKRVPVDGASKMPDEMMESVEPFDSSAAVPFKTAYLSGFLADKYDIDDKECIRRATERIKKTTADAFAGTVSGYASVGVQDSHIELSDSKASYALYPVWLLTTSFEGKQYLFAVNGQTGKIVGDLLVDNSLLKKDKLLWTFVFGAAAYAVLYILGTLGGML